MTINTIRIRTLLFILALLAAHAIGTLAPTIGGGIHSVEDPTSNLRWGGKQGTGGV